MHAVAKIHGGRERVRKKLSIRDEKELASIATVHAAHLFPSPTDRSVEITF
jgi:hypothetical protein